MTNVPYFYKRSRQSDGSVAWSLSLILGTSMSEEHHLPQNVLQLPNVVLMLASPPIKKEMNVKKIREEVTRRNWR